MNITQPQVLDMVLDAINETAEQVDQKPVVSLSGADPSKLTPEQQERVNAYCRQSSAYQPEPDRREEMSIEHPDYAGRGFGQ